MGSGPAAEKPAVLFAFSEQAELGRRIARRLGWSFRAVEVHAFPDGESLVRLKGAPRGRPTALLRSLDDPNRKLLETLMALDTLRREGASTRILVAPYMCYMRQDAAFRPGEAVSQTVVGKILSRHAERIVTVDPHLHRAASLWAVFRRPGAKITAAPLFAGHVRALHDPLVLGPDAESAPWVAALADAAGVEGAVAEKARDGDDLVSVTLPGDLRVAGRDVVLLDDVVSTGATAVAAARALARRRPRSLRCFVSHAVFAEGAEARLRAAGYDEILSTNSIPHPTNAVDLAGALAEALGAQRVAVG